MQPQKISPWVIGYAIFSLGLAILFGALAYLNRGFQFPELIGNPAAFFPIGLFANRNLAVAVAFIVALILRNRSMLLILFIIRFATDLFDFIMSLVNGVEGIGAIFGTLLFFGLLLWVPELLSIRWLWRSEKAALNKER